MNDFISFPIFDGNKKFLGVVYSSDLDSNYEEPVKNLVKSRITYGLKC